MGYDVFLRDLLADGRVTVPDVAPIEDADLLAGDAILAEFEGQNRLEMPGKPPEFVASAGRWAGTRIFRACQFVVHRDVDEFMIAEELNVPYAEPVTPAVHYSVDLVFRFLPDVARLTFSAAENDPLGRHLLRLACDWPLSSVGMADLEKIDVAGFAANPSLMRLYADRIIAKNDTDRLSDFVARSAVREALGMFPDLAEKIDRALLQYDQQPVDAQDPAS